MPCPFCLISSSTPPSPSPSIISSPHGSAYPVLSTSTVIAFLDIAPLSPGHVLVCPRRHIAKSTEMTVEESAVIGFWLPVLTRAILRALEVESEDTSWNVIQANGAEAGQTVPHSHFHIIPRPGGNREASEISDAERKNIALGEGPRVKLNDKDGKGISEKIRQAVREEVKDLREKGAIEGIDEDGLFLRSSGNGLKL